LAAGVYAKTVELTREEIQVLKMQMQGHHYKRHPKGMKKQGTSMAALNEVYTQHHGVFSTGATINGGPPPMLNML